MIVNLCGSLFERKYKKCGLINTPQHNPTNMTV